MDEYEEALFEGLKTQGDRPQVEATKPRKRRLTRAPSAQDIIDEII